MNQRLKRAVLVCSCRVCADEALSSLGQECSEHEVELSAGSADMSEAGALSAHLAKKVNSDTAVYRNEVVKRRNRMDAVNVIYRRAAADRIIVDKVSYLLCSAGKSIYRQSLVYRLSVSQLTGVIEVYVRVNEHLAVRTEISDIRGCQE